MLSKSSTSKIASRNSRGSRQRPKIMQATQNTPSLIFTKYVGTVRAKAHSQQLFSLGNFSPNRPAKGFSIAFMPNVRDKQAVAAEIKTSGTPNRYELTLSIVNNSNKPVHAEVWGI